MILFQLHQSINVKDPDDTAKIFAHISVGGQ